MNEKRVSSLARFSILIICLLVGLYLGAAGITKANIVTADAQAKSASPKSVIVNINGAPITFRSLEDYRAIQLKEGVANSLVAWVLDVPDFDLQLLSGMGFGLLGGFTFYLSVLSQTSERLSARRMFLRLTFGSIVALMLPILLYLFPSALSDNGGTLRLPVVFGVCFLGGAFSDKVWKQMELYIERLFKKDEEKEPMAESPVNRKPHHENAPLSSKSSAAPTHSPHTHLVVCGNHSPAHKANNIKEMARQTRESECAAWKIVVFGLETSPEVFLETAETVIAVCGNHSPAHGAVSTEQMAELTNEYGCSDWGNA